jgi:predicted O-methyltransferase YrrM
VSIIDDRTVWGGWTLGVPGARLIADALDSRQPICILEAGSGSSTAVFGEYARRTPQARVISLESDAVYFQATKRMLVERGLDGWVDLRMAALRVYPLRNRDFLWYENLGLPEGIDFVLVDGPPGHVSSGRIAAMTALWPMLAPDFELWLDDAQRSRESNALRQWAEFGVQVEMFDNGPKQIARVRR